MPVILEIINRPDAADLADLEKIYADYPFNKEPSPSKQPLSTWIETQRNVGQTLIAGRFNGHLLASLYINRTGRITHLSVRASTRRRGTARQLLQLLQRTAAQLQLTQLEVRDAEALAPLWQQLGFTRDKDGWLWTLR
jgi:ribosomal protein S18 acetylase RimI-like enzyme